MKQLQSMMMLLCITVGVEAKSYTLKEILTSAKEHHMLAKSIEKEALALQEATLASTASKPFELLAEGAQARPELGERGYEYAVGISKEIVLGKIQEQERNIGSLRNQATLLDAKKALVDFGNGLKNYYHQYCLDRAKYRSFRQSYDDLQNLYQKKKRAYEYQEIAKTELLQIESEKVKLFAELQAMKMQAEIVKEKILMLSRVQGGKHTELSCRDIYPIRQEIDLKDTFELTNKAYQKRKESTQEKIKRYSHAIESVSLYAQYGKELDVDRYTVGVSLPLHFTSKRSEYERVAAMYENEALEYRYKQQMLEKKSMLKQLQSELKNHAIMVDILTKNYQEYKQKVLPMIQNSYEMGETSVIEYLLNRQKLYTLNQEVFAAKKAYYETLFGLYTLIEKRD